MVVPPDVKDLIRLGISRAKAVKIRDMITGKQDPAPRWYRDIGNRSERVMAAVNQILGSHGVEPISIEGAWVDNFYGDMVATYCNTGDPYNTTLIFETLTGRYHVTDWASYTANLQGVLCLR